MTIPHNKPTTIPTPSDAVVELMIAKAIMFYEFRDAYTWETVGGEERGILRDKARAVLSTLSDAGLAVLPLEATGEMNKWVQGADACPVCGYDAFSMDGEWVWEEMAKRFHPSQLEKTDE